MIFISACASSVNILTDVVVPFGSALLGGFVTMLGVILTIHNGKKKDAKRVIESVRPWIYSVDSAEKYDPKTTNDIYLKEEHGDIDSFTVVTQIIIRNTDNGIGLVKSIHTKSQLYIPYVGKVLEKNKITYLHICGNNVDIRDLVLTISDVYGNNYKYTVSYGGSIKQGWRIEEINPKTKKREKKLKNDRRNELQPEKGRTINEKGGKI